MKIRLAVLLAAPLVFALALGAQTNPNLETGFKPYGSYDSSKIDSVNLMTGNITVNIPIISYPQRGSLGYNVSIVYNNKSWRVSEHCNLQYPEQCTSKWLPVVSGSSVGLKSEVNYLVSRALDPYGAYIYTLTDYQGGSHMFSRAMAIDPLHSGYSVRRPADGSGYTLSTNQNSKYDNHPTDPIYVRDKHGNTITFDSTLRTEDPNGNLILAGSAVTDSLGRVVSPTSVISTTDFVGCHVSTRPFSYSTILSYPGPNGGTAQVKVCSVLINLKTDFQETDEYENPITEYQPSANGFVQSYILYDGSSWSTSPQWIFEYADNSDGTNYGDLTKITLPTGGSIAYQWGTDEVCNLNNGTRPPGFTPASRVLATRSVDAGDGIAHTTTYWLSFNQLGGYNTVTDALGNWSVHSFGVPNGADLNSCGFYEYQTDWYGSGGGLLKTEATQYSVIATGMSDLNANPITEALPSVITTTLPNGKVSQVQRDYVDSDGVTGTYLQSGVYSSNNHVPYGNLIEERVYDYGSGAHGVLLKRTHNTYKAFQTSSFLNLNFLDRVASTTVYNGAGTQVAQTTYGYDEYSLQASGVPSTYLDGAIGSVRGNQTSVSRWLNTPSGTVQSTTKFYDSGMPYQATDPKLNTTTYSYSLDYKGAYVTQTQMPTTNGVPHVVSGTYDLNTGLLTTFIDQNTKTSTYVYDSLARISSAAFPDHGSVTFSYPSLTQVVRTQAIDGQKSKVDSVSFDGVGRKIHQTTTAPEGAITVDTTYDAIGEVHTVSNPYVTGTEATTGLTTYYYDGLGRAIQVVPPGGTLPTTPSTCVSGNTCTTYNDNVTIVTDASGRQRQSTSDGLGRLANVTEPNPSSGSLTSGSFLTTYLYDALGNLTSVTQNGSRPRSFTYDSLSRLLTASNPESGTITYAYDANSNVASKIAPAPNQTGTTTVATSYCYDALNRLLGKAYGSSVLSCPLSTPPVVMTYDVGPAGSSPIGRLSSDTYTTGSSTVSNTYTYTYDPVMGHSETTTECVGGAMGCQTTKGHYNLAGAMDTLTYPSGRVINNGYDTAARLNNVAFASFGSTTETYSYYTVPQTAPDGKPGFWPTGAPYWTAFGNGVTEAVGMNNRLQPIQFTATGAAPPRCHPRPS